MRGTIAKHFTKQERLSTAALQNEQLTRQRVGILEVDVGILKRQRALDMREAGKTTVALSEYVHRKFWGRLKWLFFGR